MLRGFEQWFQVFGELETEFAVLPSPCTVKAADLPVDIQLEIVDLQCDQDLKDQFASSDLGHILQGNDKLKHSNGEIALVFLNKFQGL